MTEMLPIARLSSPVLVLLGSSPPPAGSVYPDDGPKSQEAVPVTGTMCYSHRRNNQAQEGGYSNVALDFQDRLDHPQVCLRQ